MTTEAPLRIVYPLPENSGDDRNGFPLLLLRAALERSGLHFELQPASGSVPQERNVQELAEGSGELSVLWTMTNRTRETLLLPIRLPIDKGTLGWRVALVSSKRRTQFEQVHSLAELRHFVAGQGHGWPDIAVMRAAGLPVLVVDQYKSLFPMLSAGRFDYFPRSITEVIPEAERNSHFGLEVEPELLLHYPACSYFFVNRRNAALAEALRSGLEATIRDGTFERLFQRAYAADLSRLRLARRRVIEIDNPGQTAEMPLARHELWFQPGEQAALTPADH